MKVFTPNETLVDSYVGFPRDLGAFGSRDPTQT